MQDPAPRINRRDYSLPQDKPPVQAMPPHHPVVEPLAQPSPPAAPPIPEPSAAQPVMQPAPTPAAMPPPQPPPQPPPDPNVSYLSATSNELHVEQGCPNAHTPAR